MKATTKKKGEIKDNNVLLTNQNPVSKNTKNNPPIPFPIFSRANLIKFVNEPKKFFELCYSMMRYWLAVGETLGVYGGMYFLGTPGVQIGALVGIVLSILLPIVTYCVLSVVAYIAIAVIDLLEGPTKVAKEQPKLFAAFSSKNSLKYSANDQLFFANSNLLASEGNNNATTSKEVFQNPAFGDSFVNSNNDQAPAQTNLPPPSIYNGRASRALSL